jgi:hypothetical protein
MSYAKVDCSLLKPRRLKVNIVSSFFSGIMRVLMAAKTLPFFFGSRTIPELHEAGLGISLVHNQRIVRSFQSSSVVLSQICGLQAEILRLMKMLTHLDTADCILTKSRLQDSSCTTFVRVIRHSSQKQCRNGQSHIKKL